METRNCQNCKQDFNIEADDFSFYEKIKVPPPTFCPQCRLVRRLMWRNERSLHKRKCSMCKENIISMYDENAIFPVYCPSCYRSDNWEAREYAQEYDFNKSFFSQFLVLFNKVPRQSVIHNGTCLDAEYANYLLDVKNVFLSYSIILGSEYVYYSSNIDKSANIIDSLNITEGNLLYENVNGVKNYNCKYSYWSSNCIDCNFILDCNNCQDCFGCVNIHNKRFCILNEQYTKDEYESKLKLMDIGSHSFVKKFEREFWNFTLDFPRKYSRSISAIDSSGDELRNTKNSIHTFNSYNTENVKYCLRSLNNKESFDICNASKGELFYEHASSGSDDSRNIKFVITGKPGLLDVEYVDLCQSSSDLFGCVGLKNKKYCILNMQYEKDTYFEMIEKIKKHMDDMPYIDAKGRVYKYGEFFPTELCPFGYNETTINDHFPLSKEEIINQGYRYKEKEENKYTITLKAKDIPDNIKDTSSTIVDEVIECEISKRAFKITPLEFKLYQMMNIPIPRLHPDERYKERLKLRNPMILYHRSCMRKGCNNEFKTTYAPSRLEIIYCESCYQQEVY